MFSEICLPIILDPAKLTVNSIHRTPSQRHLWSIPTSSLPSHPRGSTFDLATKETCCLSLTWYQVPHILIATPSVSNLLPQVAQFQYHCSWNGTPVHWAHSLLPRPIAQTPASHGGTPALLPSCPHSLYFHVLSSTQLNHSLGLSYWIILTQWTTLKKSPQPCWLVLIHDQSI